MNKKLFILSILIFANLSPVFSAEVTKSASQVKPVQTITAPTYAEVSDKKISDEISSELADDKENMVGDLNILWQAAVEKSETIRFAISKLSNPNGEPVNNSTVKKILAPITNVAAMIGSAATNPIAEGGALLSGDLMNTMLSDDSLVNNKLSKVTDADLVLLAQKIEDMQQKLVKLYFNYTSNVEQLSATNKVVATRYRYYVSAQKLTPETAAVADVFYRNALDTQQKARQDMLISRAALEQFVGNEAISAVDTRLKERFTASAR